MNTYNNKIEEYSREIPNKMYIFEVTKYICNFSTLIYIYKNEMLIDLYTKVGYHFDLETSNIQLSIKIPHHDDEVIIPNNELKTVHQFINEYTRCSPPKMSPIYDIPAQVVYRIYLS